MTSVKVKIDRQQDIGKAFNLMLMPAVIVLGLLGIMPLLGMVGLSLTDFDLAKGWRGEFGLENFSRLLGDQRFLASISVMFLLTVLGLIFQLTLGIFIAVGLEKILPKWRFMRGLFVSPFVVPAVAVALIWLTLFTPTLSPINAFLAVLGIEVPALLTTKYGAIFAIVIADTWSSYPFVMLLILAALQGISADLEEAASIDGASKIQIFFRITLPLLKPAILMIALFRTIEMLKHFPLIFVMTNGGPGRSTQATNYYAFVQTFQTGDVSYGAAVAMLLFVFAAVISFFAARANARLSDV